MIQWTVNGGNEDTIDHYSVFISTDGTNLAKVVDEPEGTHTVDLGGLSLPPATYLVYVKTTGKPSFQNKMSLAIAYHPGDQSPNIVLDLCRQAPSHTAHRTAGPLATSPAR
jgi:hypothetical protein